MHRPPYRATGSLLLAALVLAAGVGCAGHPHASGVTTHTTTAQVASAPASGITSRAQVVGSWSGVPVYRTEYLSPAYAIDRIFKSMQGPASQEQAGLTDSPAPELLWITGYSAVVTGPDGVTEASPEFMCHANLDVDGAAYQRACPSAMPPIANRLFSLDQGTLDVKLPEGFGIPVESDVPMLLNTQVLNHNVVGAPFQVRMRLRVDFVRDRDLARPLKALTHRGVFGMVLVQGPDGHFNVDPAVASSGACGPSCSIAASMSDARGFIDDHMGRKFSSFWRVEPGRHTYHTRVTPILGLAYDTRVHFMSAHLHPFAESIELVDVTTGRSVHRLRATQAVGKIGLASVETFSSVQGLPLVASHEYDLVTVYDNTTDQPQDAMASLLLYVRALDLKLPARTAPIASR